jgi:hypothetical protein
MSITAYNPVCPICTGWLSEVTIKTPNGFQLWLKCMSCGFMKKDLKEVNEEAKKQKEK